MNKKILRIVALTAISWWIVLADRGVYADESALVTQPDFPKIIYQPEDQMVYVGSNATFTVNAENADGYQWLRNGNPLNSQTNSSLTISNANIKDVGYYSCNLFKDIEVVPTRAASLADWPIQSQDRCRRCLRRVAATAGPLQVLLF